MKFGEKLKQLRKDNGLTQEALAEKLYVTRTAISKWETDKGFPAIDSLKSISELFNVSIDDLISDSDVQTKRALDAKRTRIMYCIAICFLALATACTLVAYFFKLPYLNIVGTIAAVLYIVFGFLSSPGHRRISAKKMLLPYVISRIVVLLFMIGLIVFTIVTL